MNVKCRGVTWMHVGLSPENKANLESIPPASHARTRSGRVADISEQSPDKVRCMSTFH